MEEAAEPVQMAAYKSDSLEKVSVSQQRMMDGHGPSTKNPGGGFPETFGELWIEPSNRLDSSPKLFVRPNPAVLVRPSERCDKDRSDIG